MKIYKCDNKNCNSENKNLTSWIEIGSSSGNDLKIKNKLPKRKLIEISNHTNIHFCSIKCMSEMFVKN